MAIKKVSFPGDYLEQPLIGEGLTDASFGLQKQSPLGNTNYANEAFENNQKTETLEEEEEEEEGKREESSDDDEVIIYEGKLPETPPSELLPSRPPRKSFFEAQQELAHHFTGDEKEIRLEVCYGSFPYLV